VNFSRFEILRPVSREAAFCVFTWSEAFSKACAVARVAFIISMAFILDFSLRPAAVCREASE